MTPNLVCGRPLKVIVKFAVPVLLGTLFQQMYNIVDAIIVGHLIGTDALAAIGSTAGLSFFFVGFVNGVCSGFSIAVSQYYGAGDFKGMRKCVMNAFYLTIGLAAAITALSVAMSPLLLHVMNTPEDIYGDAYIYIVTIYWGIPCTFLFNFLLGVMRALGDSRSALYFLIFSSCMNIVLDLLFVMALNAKVFGVALATVLAQGITAGICYIYIKRSFPVLKLQKNDVALDIRKIQDLCELGIPIGLQFSITAIGSNVLQAALNSLGSVYVAASSVASKVHGLVQSPFDSIGVAAATFSGQNLGAGENERIVRGFKANMLISLGYSVFSFAVLSITGTEIARLFIKEEGSEILTHVHSFLFINGSFYWLLAILTVLRNTLQGISFSRAAMFAGVMETIARCITSFVLVGRFKYMAICFANSLAWLLADLLLVPLYIYAIRKLKEGGINKDEIYQRHVKVNL